MAISPNGIFLPSGRKRLRVARDIRVFEIERPDGDVVTLNGYVKGPGCPISVLIEVEEAWAAWSENRPTEEETGRPATDAEPAIPGTLSRNRYFAKANRAERTLRRELLMAVIPDLALDDADVLASDDGPWRDVLIDLGWWEPDRPREEADDAPEAQGESSTGDDDSPGSVSTTRASTSSP